jgi:Histidine kinase
MNETRRPFRLDLLTSLVAGYTVWFIPCCARWATAGISWRAALYACVSNFAIYLLAVAIIGKGYGFWRGRAHPPGRSGIFALLGAIPLIAVSYLFDYWVTREHPALGWEPPTRAATAQHTLLWALTDSLGICIFLGAIFFLPTFARAHEERQRELERLQRAAELLRIRTQLEPHFILNSLNAVAGLVEDDAAQARELLAALGDLFRAATLFRPSHTVREELEWLRGYVTIHELRHPGVLKVTWEIDEACLDLSCPALLLQPIVENALTHGALRGGGHLAVRVCRESEELAFRVEDDGPALGEPRVGGQGLAITRRRLELDGLPGDAFVLSRDGDRTTAQLRVPIREGAHP